MAETYKVDAVKYKGEKDNPHGGTLHKFYVTLSHESGDPVPEVYWQRKSRDLEVGTEVYGHIEDGEYGPRFKTDQRPDGSGNQGSSGGTFNRHFERVPDNSDRSRRIERQHSQEMAIRTIALLSQGGNVDAEAMRTQVQGWTAYFQQDLDADVGGGPKSTEASPPTADVSAGAGGGAGTGRETVPRTGPSPSSEQSLADTEADLTEMKPGDREASPAQKGKLTQLFGKAGLSREAMKAVVLFRCRSEKATKDGASKLIQDLMDGATHDALLAEIHDAKRAGDPLAIRAAALIPSDTPLAEPEPEPVVEPNGEDKVPF